MESGQTLSEHVGITKRERNRIQRTRVFLDTAIEIVTTEGFDALTMQRLADATESAIGAVYRYFPSKGALVAEVQREAVDRIATSYTIIRDRSDREFLLQGLDERELALSRVVMFGRFFVALADTLPQELRLLQALMGEMRTIIPLEEGLRVLPSVMRLMLLAQQAIEEAEDVGVFSESAGLDRVVTFAASVNGVMRLSTLDRYDTDLFDGERLARVLALDLFRAWGADDEGLAMASSRVDAIEATGPLAPPPPGTRSGATAA